MLSRQGACLLPGPYRPICRVKSQCYIFADRVSNWHVAGSSGASVIRINRNDTKIEAFEFNSDEWVFDPSGHDIAISPPLPFSREAHKAEALSITYL